MKTVLMTLVSLFSAAALADTGTFTVKGMHCSGCVKMIESKVCKIEGFQKCSVQLTDEKNQIGKVTVTSKDGSTVDPKAVEAAVKSAGDYEITKTDVK